MGSIAFKMFEELGYKYEQSFGGYLFVKEDDPHNYVNFDEINEVVTTPLSLVVTVELSRAIDERIEEEGWQQ